LKALLSGGAGSRTPVRREDFQDIYIHILPSEFTLGNSGKLDYPSAILSRPLAAVSLCSPRSEAELSRLSDVLSSPDGQKEPERDA